jgi:PTH1 family peptidyl-tRNA hydrolase
MQLIIGLGNPGEAYSNTRHNLGFMVVDAFASALGFPPWKRESKYVYSKAVKFEQTIMLAKPKTYMNLSGEAVSALVAYYRFPIDSMIVVYDDLDLEPGQIRIRSKGSAGGHKGIRSIIAHLGTDDFIRLRIGIGKASGPSVSDYVLSPFSVSEATLMKETVTRAAEALTAIVQEGIIKAQNIYN